MGIRKNYGKNKKSNQPTDAANAEREGVLRHATKTVAGGSRWVDPGQGNHSNQDRPGTDK